MPTYITIPESSTIETVVDTFGGYNHNYKIGDGEFYDMKISRAITIRSWVIAMQGAL